MNVDEMKNMIPIESLNNQLKKNNSPQDAVTFMSKILDVLWISSHPDAPTNRIM